MVMLKRDARSMGFPVSGRQCSCQKGRFGALFSARKSFAIKSELRNVLPSYNLTEFKSAARGNERKLLPVGLKALELAREEGCSVISRNAMKLVSDSLDLMDTRTVNRLSSEMMAVVKNGSSITDASEAVGLLAKALPKMDSNRRSDVEAAVANACYEGLVSSGAENEFNRARSGPSRNNVVMDVYAEPLSESAMA